MEFVVQKGEMLRELQYVQGVVEKKTTVPILSNLLLETTGNTLVITGTDLDVTIRCSCPAAVKVAGSVTVSARKLFNIVRLLPDSEIHFKMSGGDEWVAITCQRYPLVPARHLEMDFKMSGGDEWVAITCQRSRFKVASLSKENFPDVPQVDSERLELPAASVRFMISRCIFAITQEESRFALNGALMILRPNQMMFVATDGHRLALVSATTEIPGVEGEMKNLVPKKTLVELVKLAASGYDTIQFAKDSNHLLFQVGERILISRMLSGQFPNYEMVIPKDNDRDVKIDTVELSDTLKRVAIMADEQSRAIKLNLSEGQLDVSSNNADLGEAKASLPVEFEGETLSICFNAGYLLEFLSVLDSEKVTLQLRDGETQGLFSPADDEEYSYQYVVMPMQL